MLSIIAGTLKFKSNDNYIVFIKITLCYFSLNKETNFVDKWK
jgi:hypothetical protein